MNMRYKRNFNANNVSFEIKGSFTPWNYFTVFSIRYLKYSLGFGKFYLLITKWNNKYSEPMT